MPSKSDAPADDEIPVVGPPNTRLRSGPLTSEEIRGWRRFRVTWFLFKGFGEWNEVFY